MSCCCGGYHGPCRGGPRWWYEQTPIGAPETRRRRRREDLEGQLEFLEEEVSRIRAPLDESRNSR